MTDSQFERQIELLQKGDKQGLKEIYDKYAPMIYSVINGIVKNSHDSEDITSDFFLKLWNVADTYCFGGKHKRWLVTIARNMALDFLRKNGRITLSPDGDIIDVISPESVEDGIVENSAVSEALRTLNVGEREIVNMRLYADMTFKEIAAILKKPLGTVTWNYQNALKKLKENISLENFEKGAFVC